MDNYFTTSSKIGEDDEAKILRLPNEDLPMLKKQLAQTNADIAALDEQEAKEKEQLNLDLQAIEKPKESPKQKLKPNMHVNANKKRSRIIPIPVKSNLT